MVFHFLLSEKGMARVKAWEICVNISPMSRLERIMDMINVLCLEEGRLNYAYIRDKYGMSNREFRRDIEFIRERLTDIGYLDKFSSVEYVRTGKGNYYVYNGDKPKLNEAFANSTIAEALRDAAKNPLREQFDISWTPEKKAPEGLRKPVKYLYSAIEKVDYNVFTTLVAAIKETRVVEVEYVNTRGKSSVQKLNPMEIINYSQLWYLKAESVFGSIITYNLSRIRKARMLEEKFVFNEEKLRKSEGAYGIFSSAKAEPQWYTIRFYADVANIVSNQIWHNEQKSRWCEDGGYELSVPAVKDVEVMGKMLSFAPDAVPVAPMEFVEKYRTIVKKCMEKLEEGEK
mgnify:FL=1